MSLGEEETHTISRLIVEAFAEEVDAAGDLKLKAMASSSPALDLRGLVLLFRDHEGAPVGTAELAEFDGEINETKEVVLKVPAKVGTYTWSVVFPASAFDGIALEEVSEPFTVSVRPHATRIVVWDVPSSVVMGSKFRFKVGLKCSSACNLEGRELSISDSEGLQIGAAKMGGDIWRGSAALYFVEIELDAPAKEGLSRFEVRVPAQDAKSAAGGAKLPHAETAGSLGIQIVPPPEFLVRVEVTDKDSKTPLKGASVVLHPYRAVTDEHGVAQLRMSKGQYKLQVSKAKYLARVLPIEVLNDLAITTELVLEPIIDPHELYY